MVQLKDFMSSLKFNFIAKILIALPLEIRIFFSKCLAFLWLDLLRIRRKVALSNLDIVFPKKSKKEKLKIARTSMFNQSFNFFEFCMFPSLDENWISQNIKFEGLEYFEEALKKGKGVFLLSLHMGHGDMAVSMLAHRGYKVSLISKNFSNKWINQFWYNTRKKFNAKFIEPHGASTPFEILRNLRGKESVVFVLDQFMGEPFGIETTFFGVKTGTAIGLSLFAMKSGAPVIPIFNRRTEDFKNHITFLPEVSFESKSSKEETLFYMTQKYNYVLESLILKYPEDWMWIHRRFKPFS
jgi:KDO2-lipid IV(A) lauroyltransferase